MHHLVQMAADKCRLRDTGRSVCSDPLLRRSHLQKRSRVCEAGADRSKEKYCNLCTGRRRRITACQSYALPPLFPKHVFLMQMAEIRKCRLAAPVKAGTVVIKGILGLDADVIVTKNVEKRKFDSFRYFLEGAVDKTAPFLHFRWSIIYDDYKCFKRLREYMEKSNLLLKKMQKPMKCKRRKKCQINVLIILHGMNILWELPLYQADGPRIQVPRWGHAPVSQDNKILSMGASNGFPKGCSDDEFPWGKEHELDDPYNAKYFLLHPQ